MKKISTLTASFLLSLTLFAQSPFNVSDIYFNGKLSSVIDGNADFFTFENKKQHYLDAEGKEHCLNEGRPMDCLNCLFLGNKLVDLRATKAGIETITYDITTCTGSETVQDIPLHPAFLVATATSSPSHKVGMYIEIDRSYEKVAFHALDENAKEIWSIQRNLKYEGATIYFKEAVIDDEGNAAFFARATVQRKQYHFLFYKPRNENELKSIPLEINVTGEVQIQCSFDKLGYLHLYGGTVSNGYINTNSVGFFYGKMHPEKDEKMVASFYELENTGSEMINWSIENTFTDSEGNTTLCAIGTYTKTNGSGFSKLSFIQFDKNGKKTWVHELDEINLKSVSYSSLGYTFLTLGENYIFLYYTNDQYLKYTNGINIDAVSTQPKLNQLQYYYITKEGNLSKGVLDNSLDFRFHKESSIIRDNYLLLISYKDGHIKKLTW